MAGHWDVLIDQGADWRPSPPIWKNDDGSAIDLSLYSGHLVMKSDYASTTVLAELSSAFGNLVLGADGSIKLILTALQTALFVLDLTQIKYVFDGQKFVKFGVYDLRLTSPIGEVTKLLSGTVYVAPGVTMGN